MSWYLIEDSELSLYVHLYKTDTSVKRTPRVGPCLSLHPLFDSLWDGHLSKTNTYGAFHLVKISRISSSAVNGTRFGSSSHWKIPRKSGKSKKVVPFSRLEFPNGMSCSIYVSRSLYQFQVHGRAPPRTGVYDQMEQLFTNRKFHFCYHRNFRVFFP